MEGPRRTPTSGDTMPARTAGIAHVVGQMRAQRVRLVLMRVAFAGTALLVLLFLLWVIPWVPIGMTTENYSAGVAGAFVLGSAAFGACLAFILIWGPSFRNESVPEFLRVLFGAQQLIRGRSQFYSRIALECVRARKDRRKVFSLIVVQLPANNNGTEPDTDDNREIAAMIARGIIRAEDVVADSWPREVWLLSVGAGREACASITHRLAEAFQRTAEPFSALSRSRIGVAIFGEDGDDPDALFAAAYRRLEPLRVVLRAHDQSAA